MRHAFFVFLITLPLASMAAEPFVVKDMRVEGLQRISEGTVFNYLPIICSSGNDLDTIRVFS